ncbi:MAG: hypothetical protein AABX29_06820 [Nanoarchaeota archaeon]
MKVKIFKSRTGSQGIWSIWEYDASIEDKDAKKNEIIIRKRWHLNAHKNLDSLAEELSNLPNVRNIFLAKGDYEDLAGVSLCKSGDSDVLTQYGGY